MIQSITGRFARGDFNLDLHDRSGSLRPRTNGGGGCEDNDSWKDVARDYLGDSTWNFEGVLTAGEKLDNLVSDLPEQGSLGL